jgi:hypothetical protein
MNNKYLKFILLFTISLLYSCSEDSVVNEETTGETTLSFYNLDAAVATPVTVYIDNEAVGYTSASYMSNHVPECGNMDLNIFPSAGSHTFALVASNNYYTTGSFTISNGQCLKIPYSGPNFTSINYGTNNGSLSIMTNVLNLNQITVWIDNNNVGVLQEAPLGYICGENLPGYVISLVLPPGSHTFHAIEYMDGGGTRTWEGTRMINPNQCQSLVFGL